MKNDEYFERVKGLYPEDLKSINQIIQVMLTCIRNQNSIWIIGNGGSASTADHFEVDLSYVRLNESSHKIKAKSLCSNSALITAIGNDIGFEKIFSHQLLRNAEEGDICIAISASGNSLNLVEAFKECKSRNIVTIGLLGFDGGALKNLADIPCLLTSEKGLYGPIEDVHLSICHFIADQLKKLIFEEQK